MLSLRAGSLPAGAGRKAQMLGRLHAAGLPVLDGCVLLDGEAFDVAARQQLVALGVGPYAIRSSSPLEDGAQASAAGLYESLVDVAFDDVPLAIERVRASATSVEVIAYLEARALEPIPIAVLLQPMAQAHTLGVASGDERGFSLEERESGTPEWSDSLALRLARTSEHPVAQLLRRVERLVTGAVQVEYARSDDQLILLQVRPSTATMHRRTTTRRLPPGRWRLDAEHNPDPLSAAQAGLVALLDGPRFGPRSRVIEGYLYVREDLPARASTDVDPLVALRRFHEVLEPALLRVLRDALGRPLPDALVTYREVLTRYATEVRPALRAERKAFETFISAELGDRNVAVGILLGGSGGTTSERDHALYALGRTPTPARLRTYLAEFGAYAASWDVATPSDDEDPERLLAAAARRARGTDPVLAEQTARTHAEAAAEALRRRLSPHARSVLDRRWAALRAAHRLGESDDRLFFEAQRLVRQALLHRGGELGRRGALATIDDVFHLSLARALEGTGDLRVEADAGRGARIRARSTVPPLRIVDRVPQERVLDGRTILRGRPAGGIARGIAVVVPSLEQTLDDLPDDAVLVLPAALPSLAPHMSRLRGLVTEHGGALSHAATLARESGVAAVVGVAGALRIPNGAEVYVDGVRGRVIVLRPR